jgi:hypothetical protein
VPTSAVSELPHFSGEAATLQVPSAARNGQPPQRRWFELAPRRARLLADSSKSDMHLSINAVVPELPSMHLRFNAVSLD